MIATGVPFDEIGEKHLQALIEAGLSERRTVEYKRELPKPTDAGKREFLADASSFANASGGDLLFGVEAREGVPVRLAPLAGSPDSVKLAWEASLREGVSPRIPGVQVREVPVEGGYVLLFRIPKSWAGPHAVTYKGSFRFHSRTAAGKYALDVGQLREAFLGSSQLGEHVRNFRAERLGLIVAGETPVPLPPNPKVVLHLIPYEAFGAPPSLELASTQGSGLFRPPFRTYSGFTRWNIDGLLTYDLLRDDEPARGYAQLFRNGIYEGVDAKVIGTAVHRQYKVPYLYGHWLEEALNRGLANPLEVLRQIGVQPPLVVLVSVLGVKGYLMLGGERFFREADDHFDRDMITLPDVVLERHLTDPRDELPRVMRPIIDAFWQAGGWPKSPHYDADGVWQEK
jgi:hypothetical protein